MDIRKYLQFYEKENDLYMPNEIFVDLQKHIGKSIYIPFAYSYYYLISWLYRYAKYSGIPITNKEIKVILGYSPTYPEINYLIKKNGLLDQIGYTSTTKDFPVEWSYESELEFVKLSEQEDEHKELYMQGKNRKYSIKYPVKCFYRNDNSHEIDGTFYNVENTHYVPFEVFLFCVNNKSVGIIGFYLWSYLKMQNQLHDGKYDISLEELSGNTKLTKRTMVNYLNELKKYNMITCVYNQEFFSLALDKKDRKANTYITNDFYKFTNKPNQIKNMTIVSSETYEKIKNEKVDYVKLNQLFE